jgi:ribosomal-protein-serine acetyltransferase
MTIIIDDNIKVALLSDSHAEGLFSAIDRSREHLSDFMPWVGNMQTLADTKNYIANCQALHNEKKEISFVIIVDEIIRGRIGLHYWNRQNNTAAIGYWLTKDVLGKGIIIRACKALIDYGFSEMKLNRIEIKAATTNLKSQAIPEKLGFKKEGILREAEIVNGNYHDLVLFSLLANEYATHTRNC